MQLPHVVRFILCLSAVLLTAPRLAAQHRVLVQGNGKLAMVAADGKVEWDMPWGGIHDLHVLANGHIMVQEGASKVVEIDPKTKTIAWSYDSGTRNGNKGKAVEVHAFQPLADGRIMIAEAGIGRLIEIDRAGTIQREIKLKVKHPSPHRDTRLVRKLPTGNYLVCHEGDGAVREYDGKGAVVWEYNIPLFGRKRRGGHGPEAWGNQTFAALRLKNGNVLISTGNGHAVIEVTPAKKIVWQLHQKDLPNIVLAWVTTLEVLPNGNYLIGNCHAGKGQPLLVEIEPATKRVVWTFDQYDRWGNSVSNTRILDAPKRAVKKPNILFILTDDQRFDALGCAGHPIVKTPNLDRLAARGIRFRNAFVTTPICAASRASILTGLYERTHKFTFTTPPIAAAFCRNSYPFLLRRAGYRTALIGKFGVSVPPGQAAQMFDLLVPIGYPYQRRQKSGETRHIDQIATDRAIEFLKNQPANQPFCLSLSFNSPHAEDGKLDNLYPWPKTVDGLYEDVPIPPPPLVEEKYFQAEPEFLRKSLNRIRWYWQFDTPEKYAKNVRAYYRMISGIDHEIGRLLAELERLGLAENTVVVFMADNGYFLGERGFSGKWVHYDLSLRVPLLIMAPRLPAGRGGRIADEMALNIDIAPTLLGLAGLEIPREYQGRSLVPLVQGDKTPWRMDFFCEHLFVHPDIPQWEGVRGERYVYARYFTQRPPYEFLHDIKEDPQELTNLAYVKDHADLLARMRRRLEELRDAYGGPYSRERFPILEKKKSLKVPTAREPAEPPKPTSHTLRKIEGWTVRVDDRLLQAPNADTGRKALRFLENKLADITVVLPRDRLKKLQTVTIVLDLSHGKLTSMQYHPSAGWLKAHGYATELVKCVHLPRAADLATKRNINEQPWVILHELAHAYHDQVLGFDNPRIREAYEKYKKSGRGARTLLYNGKRVRHYALTNPMEFFAEMTEAYFGVNDFYPFTRAELRESEPEIFALLRDIWETPAK